ncbi:MAG: hypothetical protein GY699_16555 [Desulfobacteraceae bacterium]|nr:hypothetical protein [Desulfobacteraceae bacterium]
MLEDSSFGIIVGVTSSASAFWCSQKTAIFQKTINSNYSVEMEIEIEKITIGLHCNAGTGIGIIIRHNEFKVSCDNIPGTFRKFCQQFAVTKKINPQSFGNAENPVSDLQVIVYREHPLK